MIIHRQNSDGSKSVDHKLSRLLEYINGELSDDSRQWKTDTDRKSWAYKTAQAGIKHIMENIVIFIACDHCEAEEFCAWLNSQPGS